MDIFWYGGTPPSDAPGIRKADTLDGIPENSLVFIDGRSAVRWDRITCARAYLVSDLPISTPLPEQVIGVIPRDAMVVKAIVTLYTEMRESYAIGDALIRSLNEKELAIQEKQRIMLRDSRRYKAIIKNATDLIFALGPAGRVMFCNETVGRYLAGGRGSVTGRALVDFVVDEDRDALDEMVTRGFSEGVPSKAEVRFTMAGGKTGIFSCMSTPLAEEGHIYALSVIGRDITDIRAMQHRLSLQARDLTLMINGLSHELRNPLTVIGAYTKRIGKKDSILDTDRMRTALSGIDFSIRRIEEMIQRIERYEAMVNMKLSYERVNLRELVSAAVSGFPRPVKTTVEGGEDVSICTDADHVRTAFLRVLENAVDTGSETVLISLSERDGYVYVSLRDYGPGVGEDIENIFAPFYSSDPMKIGLGLTEARIVLAKIGSHIEVVPNARPGAVFTLKILADRRSGPRQGS